MVSYVASFAGVKVPPEGVCGLVNILAGEGILEPIDVAFLEHVEAARLRELLGADAETLYPLLAVLIFGAKRVQK